ncbi:vomeronasal type-1 receptor 4-like [Tachyglossus aculeatus]|uniref:vomeronasal type-1 receptor 4-like n=1 Tax=Tachyglossus aculeatus TaxID=9261 RepID=UPI0018F4236F|nr:vomeronasal type-1 receptor 4-like [Tachyglossus aculeatus]
MFCNLQVAVGHCKYRYTVTFTKLIGSLLCRKTLLVLVVNPKDGSHGDGFWDLDPTGDQLRGFGECVPLLVYVYQVSANKKTKSSDLILVHLAVANTMTLLIKGIPDILSAWELRNVLGEVGCKTLLYLYRLSRGLTIFTTCLLSIFQAVTISPCTSQWAGLKAKLPKCITPTCLLSWIFNMLVDVTTPINMTGSQNSTSRQTINILKYCSSTSISAITTLVDAIVLSFRDLFFCGAHEHHGQVQHFRGCGHSSRQMPEIRAARCVLALVTLYILLYVRETITRHTGHMISPGMTNVLGVVPDK